MIYVSNSIGFKIESLYFDEISTKTWNFMSKDNDFFFDKKIYNELI